MIEYVTDGTTASIAQKFATTRSVDHEADLNVWAYTAMENMFGQGVTQIPLPSQVPGTLTSLLWWASSDLMSIDPAFVEAGLETMMTIVFRAGVQRSYSTAGNACIRDIVDETQTTIIMQQHGVDASTAAIVIQVCQPR